MRTLKNKLIHYLLSKITYGVYATCQCGKSFHLHGNLTLLSCGHTCSECGRFVLFNFMHVPEGFISWNTLTISKHELEVFRELIS